jgi:two-component system CheB/CheR fusion protein
MTQASEVPAEPATEVPEAETPNGSPSHIVGIGASAGGLEALERFFERMPAGTGLAFVVIQHLSPDFKSFTSELLARRTSIPIRAVEDGMPVEADVIYLLPPKKDMILSNGRLYLTDKDPSQLVTLPIDYFFRSLAQDVGDRAIAIVLSGTGSDGSRGIRSVHEAGGLVVVQAPETAKFDGMPKSALKTGVVDLVLPPEEIPAALLRYIKHPGTPAAAAQIEPVQESGLEAIFRLLRNAYDIDFSHYKPATVLRRTERRLLLSGAATLDDYARRLASDADELNALYKDLLIGVTRFFRDREAFESLQNNILPQLVEQLNPDEELRVWVPGCATGEEAYSLAILLLEEAARQGRPANIKIFATDVHRASLEMAAAGIYPEASLSEVNPERLQHYFLRKGEGYQVSNELRKLVVFAQHNVVKDAPFTKLDLISCRNLLIYLQPFAQKKVLSLFHFGLKPRGILFLGPSESPGELEHEFDCLDTRWKIYRKRREVRLPANVRLAPLPTLRPRAAGLPTLPTTPVWDSQLLGTYDALLDEYMPPSLLVSEDRQLIQSFAGGSRYLRLKDGRFSPDVLDMVEHDLHMALTGALPRAFQERKPMVYKGLRVRLSDGEERLVNVTVKPVENRRIGVPCALICLEEVGRPAPPPPAEEVQPGRATSDQIEALETELRYTKENLQATIEELETSNEELQATNEELIAANEELQSTNEELHSVNEELYTVNAEYQKKIAELTELAADMDSVLTSTQVHTIFLDRKLCIRKFTPKIAETFHLLPQDIGRRIDSFTHNLDHPGLLDDLRLVLEQGHPLERSVNDSQGRSYLVRILPHRPGANIEGVVLTLIDVTNLRQAQAEAQTRSMQLASILCNLPNPVSFFDLHGRVVLASGAFHQLVGGNPLGKTLYDLFPAETAARLAALHRRVLEEQTTLEEELVLPQADGPHTYLSAFFPQWDEQGKVVGLISMQTDVTRLKRAEAQAREAVEQRDRFLAILSHELRNPLAAIANAVDVLKSQAPALPQLLDWVRVIERRSRHMARLLDDLLDISRITQNKIEIRKQLLNLAATMDDTLEEVRPWLEDRRLHLQVTRPEEAVLVEGDWDRLQQLQVNLLLNAIKYTPDGGRIWYAVRREGDRAVIRVRDNGIGIPADKREHIFELFTQVGTPADHTSSGIGVGLSLVRSLAELHGGAAQAFSDGPGTGSEFVVTLPLARAEAAASDTTVSTPLAGGATTSPAAPDMSPAAVADCPPSEHAPACPPGKELPETAARSDRPCLLLVEDDADIRDSLKALLELDGYSVIAVADGPSALRQLERQLVPLALIDIGLPGMDGYELARRLRRRWSTQELYLVALTGYGQAKDRQAARDAGFDNHLVKPLRPRELQRLLETLFPSRGENPSARSSPADPPG